MGTGRGIRHLLRFKDIALQVFPMEHRTIDLFGFRQISKSKNLYEVRRLLMKFGDKIRHLSLEYNNHDRDHSNDILNLVLEHWNGMLGSLKLKNVHIDKMMMPKLRKLFSNLESVVLNDCILVDSISSDLFSENNHLKTLEVVGCKEFIENALKYHFSRLTALSWTASDSIDHLQFKELHVERLVQNHANLQMLDLSLDSSDYLIFSSELKSEVLKTLSLRCYTFHKTGVSNIRNVLKNVTDLELWDCVMAESFDESLFAEFTKVTVLTIKDSECFDCAPNVFPHLNKLLFDSDEKGAIEFIKNHKKLKSIYIELFPESEPVFEFLADNSNNVTCLEVESLNRDDSDSETLDLNSITPLGRLGNIKKLRLWTGRLDVYDRDDSPSVYNASIFLNTMVGSWETLVHLELTAILSNHLIESIARFTKLCHLFTTV